jgi:phosphomevalonate kinase
MFVLLIGVVIIVVVVVVVIFVVVVIGLGSSAALVTSVVGAFCALLNANDCNIDNSDEWTTFVHNTGRIAVEDMRL